MGKITDITQALQKFGQQGGGQAKTEFFSLQNDKDSAVVRILLGDELEAEKDWFVVHQLEVNGKKRWIECSQESDCPLCLDGSKQEVKLFLQVYDSRDGKLKVWERGSQFIQKIVGLIGKYGSLVDRPFEIQRFGKRGDTKTTYEIYPLDKDGKGFQDFPERVNLKGGFVMSKSHSEMKALMNGEDVGEQPAQAQQRTRYTDTF